MQLPQGSSDRGYRFMSHRPTNPDLPFSRLRHSGPNVTWSALSMPRRQRPPPPWHRTVWAAVGNRRRKGNCRSLYHRIPSSARRLRRDGVPRPLARSPSGPIWRWLDRKPKSTSRPREYSSASKRRSPESNRLSGVRSTILGRGSPSTCHHASVVFTEAHWSIHSPFCTLELHHRGCYPQKPHKGRITAPVWCHLGRGGRQLRRLLRSCNQGGSLHF
jgi:hypothetical protein